MSARSSPTKRRGGEYWQVQYLWWHRQGDLQCLPGNGKGNLSDLQRKEVHPGRLDATNNPYFNSQPDVIRLADGQVLLGRVAAEMGDDRTIITRDKKILHVKASDILSQAGTNFPAAPASPAK